MCPCIPSTYLAADDMCDAHEMVVHHIGEVISREAIALHQDRVVNLLVHKLDLSMNLVVNNRLSIRDLSTADCILAIVEQQKRFRR